MSRPTRLVVPPDREQAYIRQEFLRYLREQPRYQNIISQDLRPDWRSFVTRNPGAASYSLSALDMIQRGPGETRRHRAARAAEPAIVARTDDDLGTRYRQELLGHGLTPCPELKTYLDELEAFVTSKLRLTDRGHVAWWAMTGVHDDVAELEPDDWIGGHDWWRVPLNPVSTHVRVDIKASLYSAQVICSDGTTGEVLWDETLHPEPEERHLAFDDWSAVRTASARCTRHVEGEMTRRYQDAQLQQNSGAFARVVTKELPALVTWHFTKKAPPNPATRQYLRRIARNQLGIDPLPGRKRASKMDIFLPKNSPNEGYGSDEA